MASVDLFDIREMLEDSTYSIHNSFPGKSQIYVGLEKSIVDLKELLFHREVSVVGVHCMGGGGKTTLALTLSINNKAFDVRILAIHTGPMEENEWYEMNFFETKALLLFTSSDYFLPPFLKSMKNLKFLMVCNYGPKRATVKGLDALSSLTQLKSVRLERLSAHHIQNHCKSLENLEKLSLSLCEGFEHTSKFNIKLKDFNLDHCSNLEALPLGICSMPSAQIWSISNCHLVQQLPYDIGNLSSLRMLRLSALPSLKTLPPSIGKLRWLEYLDISLCEGLRELPEETGQLKKLSEFDMRECSSLRMLPRNVCDLSSLKHVVCDEKLGN